MVGSCWGLDIDELPAGRALDRKTLGQWRYEGKDEVNAVLPDDRSEPHS